MARRAAYLKSRDEDKVRRKREALRRVAPGFEPESGPLVPKQMGGGALGSGSNKATHAQGPILGGSAQPRSVMDDVVDQLAALDSSRK